MNGKAVGLTRKSFSVALSLLLIAGAVAFISACSGGGGGGGGSDEPAEQDTNDSDTGGSDSGDTGGSTTLPADVTIAEFTGDSSEYCMDDCISNISAITTCMASCTEGDPDCIMQCYVDGGCFDSTFTITLTLDNAATETIVYEIAAGTLFTPDDSGAQTMMLLQAEEISIGAGESIHCLPVYCTNSELDAPGSEHNYSFGSVTTNSCLETVIQKCEGKQLTSEAIIRVQDIIWKCTEPEGSVTQEDWDYLDALPPTG